MCTLYTCNVQLSSLKDWLMLILNEHFACDYGNVWPVIVKVKSINLQADWWHFDDIILTLQFCLSSKQYNCLINTVNCYVSILAGLMASATAILSNVGKLLMFHIPVSSLTNKLATYKCYKHNEWMSVTYHCQSSKQHLFIRSGIVFFNLGSFGSFVLNLKKIPSCIQTTHYY